MKWKILIVDDKYESVSALIERLEQEGYELIYAEDDNWAIYYYDKFTPDLIILDIDFGNNDRLGLDILNEIRQVKNDNSTPIIMLTGLDSDELALTSYNKDADHFVRKTASTDEILALVKRCLRRSKPEIVVIDDYIEIDRNKRTVRKKTDGEWNEIHFEPKEFDMLILLVDNCGRVILREVLERFFPDADNPAKTVRRYISELRKELEPDRGNHQYILTKRGVGYEFKDYR